MTIRYIWAKIFRKFHGRAISGSRIHRTSKIEAGSSVVETTLGRNSFCGYDCVVIRAEIGAFCSIASHVTIGGASHPMDWVSTSPAFYKGKDSITAKYSNHFYLERNCPVTKIGNDVWVGEYAIIKSGVKIGNGAVVGMGSVVTKDVDPYSVVVGNPAKEIKKRFSDETIRNLMEIEWWSFDDAKLKKYATYFTDPPKFISEVMKI